MSSKGQRYALPPYPQTKKACGAGTAPRGLRWRATRLLKRRMYLVLLRSTASFTPVGTDVKGVRLPNRSM